MKELPIEIEVHYPKQAVAGVTYAMKVDISFNPDKIHWPFDREEIPIYCMINTSLFTIQYPENPIFLLHRYGGTYGKQTFFLKALDEVKSGKLTIILLRNGIPIGFIDFESTILDKDNKLIKVETEANLQDAIDKYPEIKTRIDTTLKMLQNIANIGHLTQNFLNQSGANAKRLFDDIVAKTGDINQAYQLLAYTLNRILWYAKQNNFNIDERTQKLIDDAYANGINIDEIASKSAHFKTDFHDNKPGELNHYKPAQEKSEQQLLEARIIIVGDGGAGKTSLVKKLLGQSFDEYESQTHGINIHKHIFQVRDQKITAHLWDFGGQEIMHSTHQFFLSRHSLYILVLDGRKEEKVEYWLRHIENYGKDTPVLVVLNKIDENPAFEVNRKFLKEKFPAIKGFFRLSCKTGEGLNPFGIFLENQLSELDILKTSWPISWFKVKAYLEKVLEPFISYAQYQSICYRENINDKTSRDTLLEFLNDLGTVIYFEDLELGDTCVFQSSWITTAVYKIINSPLLAQSGGVLKIDMLGKALAPTGKDDYSYPPDKYLYILQLMEKFELCYVLGRDRVLVPDLLPVREPTFSFDYRAAMALIIRYEFLPRGLLPRFMVRQHRDIEEGLQWRTGMVLKGDIFQSRAVVMADERENIIYIYVHEGRAKYYLAVLRNAFEDINHSFEKLSFSERIPLPDNPAVTVSYAHLLRLRDLNETYFLPEGANKKYLIADLLHKYEEIPPSNRIVTIYKRWQVLNDLDRRISDPLTQEKALHKIIEENLWILGSEYEIMSSGKALKHIVEESLGKKYKGGWGNKRPDLVLASDQDKRLLLLELKKTSHILNRKDEAQALLYREELRLYMPDTEIEIALLGGKIKENFSSVSRSSDVKYLSYLQLIQNARRNLECLLHDLPKK